VGTSKTEARRSSAHLHQLLLGHDSVHQAQLEARVGLRVKIGVDRIGRGEGWT